MRRSWVLVLAWLSGLALAACSSAPLAASFSSSTSTTTTSSSTTTTPTTTTTSTTTIAPVLAQALACGTPLPFYGLNPPPAGTISSTATDGPITARLSGILGANFVLSDPRLLITWDQQTLVDESVTSPQIAGAFAGGPVMPWGIVASSDSSEVPLCIAQLAGSSEPLVLIGLDSGGAHCCDALRAIALTPTSAAPPVDLVVGNPAIELQAVGGQVVVETADNVFAYQFASFAGSGMPVLIYGFEDGHFVNITKNYPSMIEADAAQWWSGWSSPQNSGGGLGLLAAWAADECNLGQCDQAFATINQLNTEGELTGPSGWPTGPTYVSDLHAFLLKNGYASS